MRHPSLAAAITLLAALGAAAPADAVPTFRAHTTISGFTDWRSPVNVGDLNGDGRDDLAMTDGERCRVHIVFGSDQTGRTLGLDTLGAAGLTLRNVGDGRCYEIGVAPAGDVNGDGRDDVAILRSEAWDGPHAGWVLFGRPAGGDVDMAALGSGGLTFTGTPQPPRDDIGGLFPQRGIGDVNGDGRDDLRVVGKSFASGPAVFFGRASGGTVNPAADGSGLLRLNAGTDGVRGVLPYGDVDRNGRGDLLTWHTRSPQLDQRFDLVAGRGPGTVDVSLGGAGVVPLTGGTYVDPDGLDYLHDPKGDIDGDGLPDPLFSDTGNPDVKIALTSKQASPLTKTSLLAGSLVFRGTASLAWPSPDEAGDVNGDGRGDLTVTATSRAVSSGSGVQFLADFPAGRQWGYVMHGRNTPGVLTFDTPPAGVWRLDSLPEGAALLGGLAFDADAGRELFARIEPTGDVVVGDLVDAPAPVDTVAPSLGTVSLDNPTISTRIPCGVAGTAACPAPRTATLDFTASEPIKLTFRLKRDTGATEISSTVWTGPGAHKVGVNAAYEVPPGWLQPRPLYYRIRPGNYTMWLEARDLAGRTAAVSRKLQIIP